MRLLLLYADGCIYVCVFDQPLLETIGMPMWVDLPGVGESLGNNAILFAQFEREYDPSTIISRDWCLLLSFHVKAGSLCVLRAVVLQDMPSLRITESATGYTQLDGLWFRMSLLYSRARRRRWY